MKHADPFSVGQVLYFRAGERHRREHRHAKHEYEMTITAVGRKWLTVKPGPSNSTARVDRQTMQVEGYMGGVGTCYRTVQARTEAMEIDRLWVHLMRHVRDVYRPPAHANSESLRKVIRLLGLPEPEPTPPENVKDGI